MCQLITNIIFSLKSLNVYIYPFCTVESIPTLVWRFIWTSMRSVSTGFLSLKKWEKKQNLK